ncbi:MAG TPA: FAD-dependent oxidoreductase, partial [Acidocella sp.]|nr:FAD-dependent oxidoreductase [Acidocella sp.]
MIDVVIVGGGAGIGAARLLASRGVEALLIEAAPRLGGRAHSHHADGMALDLGCGWLHSADRNPWVTIAAERGIAIDRRPSAWGTQYRGLGFPPEAQAQARQALSNWFTRLEESPPASDCAADALPEDATWHPYIRAIAGFISGADPANISAIDFSIYDQASTDCNWRLPAGYGALITSSLPPGITHRCNTVLESVALDSNGVRLETNAGQLRARAVILTVSTTVLASDMIRLPSGLDPWREAARQLPLGRNEKLFLALSPEAGLEEETLLMGDPHDVETGTYYIRPFGWPVIECFLGSFGAERYAREGVEAGFVHAIGQLAALLGAAIRPHLRPLIASNWTATPWIGGGYSCALPGAAAQRQILARPFENRLFFAGEATHATDFSTAHGALASGIRAAGE